MATFVYSGVTYTAPAVGTTEFALTSDSGNAIPYLSQDHIYVFTSSDGGDTWTTLTAVTQYTFNSQGTEIILATGTVAGQQIRLQRKTPLSAQYVVFSDGSLLTSNQLNQAELFSLYCDQELYDTGGGGGGGGGSISTTDDLPEGNTNLYYTDNRVESYVSGAGYVKDAGVTKLVAGTNIVLSPSSGEGIVTIQSIGGSAVNYMGVIDATGPAPSGPRNGDMYVNSGSGVADNSWAGIAGDALVGNERLIYDTADSEWAIIRDIGIPEAPSDGQLYGRKNQDWEAFVEPAAQDLQSVCDEGSVTTTTIQAAGFRIDQLVSLP